MNPKESVETRMPQIQIPRWSETAWDRIKDAPWKNGGWVIDRVLHKLHVRSNEWAIEPDPTPDPYPIALAEWQKIAHGTLQPDNTILALAGGFCLVQAVTEPEPPPPRHYASVLALH